MKILAGIDFSNVSDQVVEKSAEYALAMNAKLWLVHVVSPDNDTKGVDSGPRVIRDQRAHKLRTEHQKLQAYAEACEMKGVHCIPLLVQGTTIETLLQVLNKLNVDLVVIGFHRSSSLYDFVMGSVKTEIFHMAEIPVLLIPANLKK